MKNSPKFLFVVLAQTAFWIAPADNAEAKIEQPVTLANASDHVVLTNGIVSFENGLPSNKAPPATCKKA